jgi:hypothetical protein
VAKELDTSWFDLKNYNALKTMPIEGWIWQLEARYYYYEIQKQERRHGDELYLLSTARVLKAGVIPDDPNYREMSQWRAESLLEGHPFSTSSVDSLVSYDVWSMAKNNKLNHVWDACQHVDDFLWDIANEDLSEIAYTPHDFHIKQHSHFVIEQSAHVVINLSATDEQIKNDFSHWLTHYRRAINYQHQKKLFTQADFDYWVEYGVIPYLDLVLIAKIEGKKITQNKMAQLIFPNEYNVNIVDRLSKVTKPAAEELIKNEIYRTLSTQLVFEKANGMKSV